MWGLVFFPGGAKLGNWQQWMCDITFPKRRKLQILKCTFDWFASMFVFNALPLGIMDLDVSLKHLIWPIAIIHD
jgi:hypothetical protein